MTVDAATDPYVSGLGNRILFFLVGWASLAADATEFGSRLIDRWLATLGTARIMYSVAFELSFGSIERFGFMIGITILAFILLHLSRASRFSAWGGWRWVFFHSLWHAVSVAGGSYALSCEAHLRQRSPLAVQHKEVT